MLKSIAVIPLPKKCCIYKFLSGLAHKNVQCLKSFCFMSVNILYLYCVLYSLKTLVDWETEIWLPSPIHLMETKHLWQFTYFNVASIFFTHNSLTVVQDVNKMMMITDNESFI